jgi:hypothetical protein
MNHDPSFFLSTLMLFDWFLDGCKSIYSGIFQFIFRIEVIFLVSRLYLYIKRESGMMNQLDALSYYSS